MSSETAYVSLKKTSGCSFLLRVSFFLGCCKGRPRGNQSLLFGGDPQQNNDPTPNSSHMPQGHASNPRKRVWALSPPSQPQVHIRTSHKVTRGLTPACSSEASPVFPSYFYLSTMFADVSPSVPWFVPCSRRLFRLFPWGWTQLCLFDWWMLPLKSGGNTSYFKVPASTSNHWRFWLLGMGNAMFMDTMISTSLKGYAMPPTAPLYYGSSGNPIIHETFSDN